MASPGKPLGAGLHGSPMPATLPFPDPVGGSEERARGVGASGRGTGATTVLGGGDTLFQSLPLLDIGTEEKLRAKVPLDPTLLHGFLPNGLAYYVRRNAKPEDRAALALVVNIGSFAEEEEERGVAHIVEHLAFSATKKYSNHDIVKFLESIGAEFGACQNAYTSTDETVYELLLPVDKPELLSTALSVLAEFAAHIRASDEDLAKERGAVLEEWRERKNAKGRMMEAHWKLLLEGSRYAERLPIGLESVIRNVPAGTVKGFYKKWYRPNNMAVVAVGDFANSPEEVLGMIREHFGGIPVVPVSDDDSNQTTTPSDSDTRTPSHQRGPSGDGDGNGYVSMAPAVGDSRRSSDAAPGASPPGGPEGGVPEARPEEGSGSGGGSGVPEARPEEGSGSGSGSSVRGAAVERLEIPSEGFVAHSEPRVVAVVEKEAEGSGVVLSCLLPVYPMESVQDYRAFLVEQMFHQVLSQRFFHVSHRANPPFYSAASNSEPLTRSTRAFSISASCQTRGTLKALEALWTEVVRLQAHGVTERELARAKLQHLSDMESAFIEKDQTYSDALRGEYVEHFLRGEPAPGIEYEARLAKTLVPEITVEEVSALGRRYSLESSCVLKILEPRGYATAEAMRATVARVDAALAAGGIPPWEEEPLPEGLVVKEPEEEGTVAGESLFNEMGAVEVTLGNGMRVCYKCTDFLDDQVLISGYAYGGLSEVPEKDYFTCALSQSIAEEVGIVGHKPALLREMLAGKRVELSVKVGTYMRVISGDVSPADLEVAFQLVYQLFATRPVASEGDMRLILQMTREAIAGQLRDPMAAFSTRVNELNYGKSRFFRAVTPSNLKKVDPVRACDFFDACFRDPSNFTLVFVGKMDPATFMPLVLRYLGGIPRVDPSAPLAFPMDFKRDELTAIPVTPPQGVAREEVQRRMIEEQSTTQITFPVEIAPGPGAVEEVARLGFLCKLLETRILRTLRFKHGHVYSVSVSPFFGHSRPTRNEAFLGDVAVSFSSDPNGTRQLVDMALEEVAGMQEGGPEPSDVAAVLEIEQRAFESGQKENSFWLDRILRGYQSRLYSGNMYFSYRAQEDVRLKVIASLTPQSAQTSLERLLPNPCRSRYTAVSLVPLPPLWRRILSLPPRRTPGLTPESKVALAVAGVAVTALVLWRYTSMSSASRH